MLLAPRQTAQGVDGLAEVLAGLTVGALLGLVGGGLLAAFLSRRAQLVGIVVGLVAALLVFAGLALTAPQRELPPPEMPVVGDLANTANALADRLFSAGSQP